MESKKYYKYFVVSEKIAIFAVEIARNQIQRDLTINYLNMADLRNGRIREKVIDQCLRSRRGYSTLEIMERCNEALRIHGEAEVTALNTIRNDIHAIENRWNVVVEEIKSGRNKRYRYEDPEFSIYNSALNEKDVMELNLAVSVLRQFDGMPGFEWVDEFTAHVQQVTYSSIKPVVGFDSNKELRGMQHFTPLFKYISNQQVVLLTYQPYRSEDQLEEVVHPYYIKEYNQRWFLIGWNEEFDRISNYALDRIVSIAPIKAKFKPSDIDFSTYFDDIVGVSHPQGREVEEIRMWVDKGQLPYTLSKPLHKSQRVLKHTNDGSALISIKVVPNYELTQLLLSFGDHIFVESPTSVREEIMERIKKINSMYKKVQLD